jgi:hypothetical protein
VQLHFYRHVVTAWCLIRQRDKFYSAREFESNDLEGTTNPMVSNTSISSEKDGSNTLYLLRPNELNKCQYTRYVLRQ